MLLNLTEICSNGVLTLRENLLGLVGMRSQLAVFA
jgi:hypothetical protein